jgi:hypothetical protein
MSKKDTILVHLPAYREPELIPTIKSALENAKHPERIHFGICRQYHPEDGFDNVDDYRNDPRFKIKDVLYTEAQGLPWARAIINEELLTDENYICQLDSHHRFAKNWDVTLIKMHAGLERKGHKPILAAYLPYYDPFNDPAGRTMEPWQQHFVCFYPHGTIFIRPGLLTGWQDMTEPPPSRFLSGHFCFARAEWAKEIKHDPDIYFSGEEINLTVRSYTHGYDMFHPHELVVWHATMREERNGMLKWDDDAKRGVDWWNKQEKARAKIRQLFKVEDNGYDLTGYDLGTVRSIHDYEKYAGVDFKRKAVQKYTTDNNYPPNPPVENWEDSLLKSFYHLVQIIKADFPHDDYEFIHLAFDDENGLPIHNRTLDKEYVKMALSQPNGYFDFEESVLVEKNPTKVVLWAYSNKRGWCERKETIIQNG